MKRQSYSHMDHMPWSYVERLGFPGCCDVLDFNDHEIATGVDLMTAQFLVSACRRHQAENAKKIAAREAGKP
jgi:hypothetical protein